MTFGSFNRQSKVLDPVLRVWAEILRALPRSRLVLKDRLLDDASQRTPMLAVLAEEGIAPDRVTFLDHPGRAGHFAALQEIDIALDPFPHGGGMTTLDALWMGVPVVTWPGHTASSRIAAACLTPVGLTDFIARDPAELRAARVAKASDLDALAHLRARLRGQVAGNGSGISSATRGRSKPCIARSGSAGVREHFPAKWSPVRRRKCDKETLSCPNPADRP